MKTLFSYAAAPFFCTVLLFAASSAQANHVDFIVDGGFTMFTDSISGPVTGSQNGNPGNILGTEREVSLSFSAGSGSIFATTPGLTIGPAGSAGSNTALEMLFSNSVNSFGLLELLYDGVGSGGLGGLDFDTAYNSIAVNMSGVQGAGNLSVIVTDSSSNLGSYTVPVAAAGIYFFPFTNVGYAGVNFLAVDSVKVTLETTGVASDFAIAEITREVAIDNNGIPEPSTFVLVSIAATFSTLIIGRRNVKKSINP